MARQPSREPGIVVGPQECWLRTTARGRDRVSRLGATRRDITLRGPHGDLSVVKVKDPSKLDAVQVGDVVDITYTEALAVAVEKAGQK